LFIGGRRGLEADLVRAAEIPFHATAMPSLRDPDSRMSLVRRAFVIPLAAVDAWWQALRFHASVCCTTGGLVSLPAVLGARAAGVPVYLWEGNVVPGRTNRLLARVAARVGTTFDESKRSLPRGRTAVVGTPIPRSLLAWKRDSGRRARRGRRVRRACRLVLDRRAARLRDADGARPVRCRRRRPPARERARGRRGRGGRRHPGERARRRSRDLDRHRPPRRPGPPPAHGGGGAQGRPTRRGAPGRRRAARPRRGPMSQRYHVVG